MPGAPVTTGFFGKIPATGDFVTRGLSSAFVRFWDSFIARHLTPFVTDESFNGEICLGFIGGRAVEGPVAGVILPSADRVGRRFPLTVACPITRASADLPDAARDWFRAVLDCAQPAQQGEIDADTLAARLADLPFPSAEQNGAGIDGLLVWRDPEQPVAVDPEAPREALGRLLAFDHEVG